MDEIPTPRVDQMMSYSFGNDREFLPKEKAQQLERELTIAKQEFESKNRELLSDLKLCYQEFLDQHSYSAHKRLTMADGIELGRKLAEYWTQS